MNSSRSLVWLLNGNFNDVHQEYKFSSSRQDGQMEHTICHNWKTIHFSLSHFMLYKGPHSFISVFYSFQHCKRTFDRLSHPFSTARYQNCSCMFCHWWYLFLIISKTNCKNYYLQNNLTDLQKPWCSYIFDWVELCVKYFKFLAQWITGCHCGADICRE